MSKKTYSGMLQFESFEERFDYLCLRGRQNDLRSSRYMNQAFYMSNEWRSVRHEVIVRDNGCDLAVPDHDIFGTIYVHHIIPVTREMLANGDPLLLDPDNLVCVCYNTHEALHYGDLNSISLYEPVTRSPHDTCPWKGGTL